MPVRHHRLDWLGLIQFVRLLGNLSTCIDPVGVYSEAWVGRSGQHADVEDHVYGAKRSGHAGASMHFEHTVHGSWLNHQIRWIGVIARAPVGTIGNPCLTDATGMLVRTARLAPSSITSMPLAMTGILELGQPELPSTTGTSGQLGMPCLSE